MSTGNPKLTIAALLVCVLSTACAGMNKSTKLPAAAPKAVRVVPVRGEPLTVVSHHLANALTLGLVGGAVEQAAAGDARAQLADRLNRDCADFKPELVLAQECAALLKASSNPAFREAILQEESVLLSEESALLKTETSPFKARRSNRMEWLSLYNKWRKGPPVSVSGVPSAPQPLCVEVRFQMLELNHGSSLGGAALVRLVDHSTRQVVGARYVGHDYYDIRPLTTDSDFTAFKEDFRKFARDLAQEALTKLNLL